jgi:hypothetical protein
LAFAFSADVEFDSPTTLGLSEEQLVMKQAAKTTTGTHASRQLTAAQMHLSDWIGAKRRTTIAHSHLNQQLQTQIVIAFTGPFNHFPQSSAH